MMRIHEELYRHLQLYPRRLLVPHRLLPYPTTVDTVVISVVMIVLMLGLGAVVVDFDQFVQPYFK
jgi:hypothetical protein